MVLSVEPSVELFHAHLEDIQEHLEDILVLLELIQELLDHFHHPQLIHSHMVIHIINKNEKRQKTTSPYVVRLFFVDVFKVIRC